MLLCGFKISSIRYPDADEQILGLSGHRLGRARAHPRALEGPDFPSPAVDALSFDWYKGITNTDF